MVHFFAIPFAAIVLRLASTLAIPFPLFDELGRAQLFARGENPSDLSVPPARAPVTVIPGVDASFRQDGPARKRKAPPPPFTVADHEQNTALAHEVVRLTGMYRAISAQHNANVRSLHAEHVQAANNAARLVDAVQTTHVARLADAGKTTRAARLARGATGASRNADDLSRTARRTLSSAADLSRAAHNTLGSASHLHESATHLALATAFNGAINTPTEGGDHGKEKEGANP